MEAADIPSASKFLVEFPLYGTVEATGDDVWKFVNILFYEGTYDSFCIHCSRSSTFKVSSHSPRPDALVRNIELEKRLRIAGRPTPPPRIPPDVYELRATCARSSDHVQRFYVRASFSMRKDEDGAVDGEKRALGYTRLDQIEKIGQWPSFGDVHIARSKKYTPVLSAAQRAELTRAIGLGSHGIGIGSFVYLRRIFEQLVEAAHSEALKDEGWDEAGYAGARMSDRVQMLRHHLPDFLVENRKVYSLLSKGIHELSEDECSRYFDTLLLSIELILDERLERKTREERKKAATAALTKALGEVDTDEKASED